MKVFISWSKAPSEAIAIELQGWLRSVIQALEPWVSSTEIEAGKRWSADIAAALEATDVGILIVTPQNITQPWLMFEAGALAKSVGKDVNRVIPYLIELKKTDLVGPLGAFQGEESDEAGTFRLVQSLNKALGAKALPDVTLKATFKVWWPAWRDKLEELLREFHEKNPDAAMKKEREIGDMVKETLLLARDIARSQNQAKVMTRRILEAQTSRSRHSLANAALASEWLQRQPDQPSFAAFMQEQEAHDAAEEQAELKATITNDGELQLARAALEAAKAELFSRKLHDSDDDGKDT